MCRVCKVCSAYRLHLIRVWFVGLAELIRSLALAGLIGSRVLGAGAFQESRAFSVAFVRVLRFRTRSQVRAGVPVSIYPKPYMLKSWLKVEENLPKQAAGCRLPLFLTARIRKPNLQTKCFSGHEIRATTRVRGLGAVAL